MLDSKSKALFKEQLIDLRDALKKTSRDTNRLFDDSLQHYCQLRIVKILGRKTV